MKDKVLSQMLKEIRFSLSLSQAEMAATLGMKEQMYALYERGKYNDSKGQSIRRQKLLDKIDILKNKILLSKETKAATLLTPPPSFALIELQRENDELRKQLLELQAKIILLQDQILNKTNKAIAQATSPKKN